MKPQFGRWAAEPPVAVMPFQFTGADTSLKPIERGFAELVTTDLSHVSRLTVLERERIQGLLDEISLQQTRASSPARASAPEQQSCRRAGWSAARSSRMDSSFARTPS